MKIYTVGYEGSDIDEFVAFLRRKKVAEIVDVRKNPVSRKKGFSKHRLAAALAEKGIQYTHYPSLGVPGEWRKKAKKEIITRKRMFSDYVKTILPLAKDDLSKIAKRAREHNIALLCYEADACDCHRHSITEKLKKANRRWQVVDLIDDHRPIRP